LWRIVVSWPIPVGMLAFEDHFGVATKIDDVMKILELVDDARLKVNLDTANATNGMASDLVSIRLLASLRKGFCTIRDSCPTRPFISVSISLTAGCIKR